LEKVGVFGLSSFFPQAERMKLAMLLNNVIASPSFGSWLQGAAAGHPETAVRRGRPAANQHLFDCPSWRHRAHVFRNPAAQRNDRLDAPSARGLRR